MRVGPRRARSDHRRRRLEPVRKIKLRPCFGSHGLNRPETAGLGRRLLGIDHKRLTFYHNGIRRRLTDVHGELIRAILA